MFTSTNPATGETVATFDALTPAQLEARIAAAAAAFADWRRTDVGTRTALLERCADAFAGDRTRLAEIAAREMGKTVASAAAEVDKCVAGFRWYAEQGPELLAEQAIDTAGGPVTVMREPLGVVLAVMPWNFPYWQVVRFLAPALLGGNAGLLKHASNVQGCAAAIAELVTAAGAPAGLFANLPVPVGAVAPIIADPRVAAVTLTGSEGAGAEVAATAGRHLKKVVLELGGSDPFIVMPSADLDAAARAAVTARIQNTGQSCICAKRMIVHGQVYDAFLERFVAGMAAVRAGDPFDSATDMGPLSSAAQRDTVLAQVAAMQAAGGRLLTGGAALSGPGAYMNAGVVVDLPPDAAVARDEVFGPVATVFRAADRDDAVRLANDTPFGLGASVWTSDDADRAAFARGLDCGMVAMNKVLASTPEAPFGGIKRSGHGRELGPWGLAEFTNLKAVYG